MSNKTTKEEFIKLAQDSLYFEYGRLRANLRAVLKESPLPDFYQAETLFELAQEVREQN